AAVRKPSSAHGALPRKVHSNQKNSTGSKITARSSRTLSRGYWVTTRDSRAATRNNTSGPSYPERGQHSGSRPCRRPTAIQLKRRASPGGETDNGPTSGREKKKTGRAAPTSIGPVKGLQMIPAEAAARPITSRSTRWMGAVKISSNPAVARARAFHSGASGVPDFAASGGPGGTADSETGGRPGGATTPGSARTPIPHTFFNPRSPGIRT